MIDLYAKFSTDSKFGPTSELEVVFKKCSLSNKYLLAIKGGCFLKIFSSMKYNEIAIVLNLSILEGKQLDLNLLKRNMLYDQDQEVAKTLSIIIGKIRELRKELSVTC